MKKFRYLFEAGFVHTLVFIFSVLPVDAASAFGGALGRLIGPLTSMNRKALNNLRKALPELNYEQHQKILKGMWDNLGRTFSEYPHLEYIAQNRMTSDGEEYLRPAIEKQASCILFTGHVANWETAAAYAHKIGINLDLIYRAPNNPYVDHLLNKYRSLHGKLTTYPKSSQGMRDIVTALKNNRNLGILIDQKYNQGVAAQFFGMTAMTSPAFAQLAQKFKKPLHPARVERIKGANFKITIYPAMDISKPIEELIDEANLMIESWIRERPEQWLWLHRRWGKQ